MLKVVKKIFFYLIVFILVSLGVFLAALFKKGPNPAILMYHSVGGPGAEKYPLDIFASSFEKQMAYLHRYHYNVIPLLDCVRSLKEGKKLPPKTVVLTFDDGYENNYTVAYPILKKYGFPATIFVIVNYLGQEKEFYGLPFRFLTAPMLVTMADSGLITIGSHTMNHLAFSNVRDKKVLWEEIRGSKVALENILKRPVLAFCYPNGEYTDIAKKLVQRAGYEVGVTTLSTTTTFDSSDFYSVKRIKITDKGVNPLIFFVETSGYYIRLKMIRQ
jgi:peptidoglycan/xylan/chitin deacetylase (PgdA/CDA1 family)